MVLWINTALLYCWIAAGSALGGIARYWCSGVAARLFGETFPWGTFVVNVSGSFIIGFFATLTASDGRVFAGSTMRHFAMLGLLGGFTTLSSVSRPRRNRTQDGDWLQAAGTIEGCGVPGPIAGRLGHLRARSINSLTLI